MLNGDSVDAAVAITLADRDVRATAAEMARIVRPGGLVLRTDIPVALHCCGAALVSPSGSDAEKTGGL